MELIVEHFLVMDTSTKIAKRIQILLVDDNPVNLTILSEILTNQGYQTRRVIQLIPL